VNNITTLQSSGGQYPKVVFQKLDVNSVSQRKLNPIHVHDVLHVNFPFV